MSRVLVVDDSPTQARALSFILEDAGFEVVTASDGLEALEKIVEALEAEQPVPFDIVVTDLQMPQMDGLELVEGIRRHCPSLPVVLMTAHGSEEIAVAALQKGAASYVPKRILSSDIVSTLNDVLVVAPTQRQRQRLLRCMTHAQTRFRLDNDPSLVPSFIEHFREGVAQMKLCDDTEIIRVSIALREALNNAIYHGNLELGSELRERDDRAYYQLAEERRKQPPYCDRRVDVTMSVSAEEAACVVRDEGPGFDTSTMPDPTDPQNLAKVSGRGLLLIRTFMDVVSHNPTGNEITMVKYACR